MRELRIREFKAAFLRLAKLVAQVGEIIVMRGGKPLLRILPATPRRHSRSKVRATTGRFKPEREGARRER